MQIVNLVYHQTAGASQCLKRSFGCKSVTPLKKADANPLNLVNLATRRKSLILFRTQRCIHTYLCIYVYLCVIGQPIAKQQLFRSASAFVQRVRNVCEDVKEKVCTILLNALCSIDRILDRSNNQYVSTLPHRFHSGNIRNRTKTNCIRIQAWCLCTAWPAWAKLVTERNTPTPYTQQQAGA